MVSHSMKLAIAESILNDDDSVNYAIGRGILDTEKELQVTRIGESGRRIVAADAIYLTLNDIK